MDTFVWTPDKDLSTSHDIENSVRTVNFGNGVVQMQKKVLGRAKRKFSLSFTRPVAEIAVIEEFLAAHYAERFNWVHPDGKTLAVRCLTMTRTHTGLVDTLSCEFQEEFA